LLSTSQPSALVAALPGGGDARLEFSDGSSQAVTADADSWLFTWTDPKTPTRITTDDGSCSVEPLDLSFGSEPPPSDAEDFTLPCGPEEATSIRVAQTPAKFCEQFVKPASTTSTTLDVQRVIDSVCANDNP
jgi:hypothetical protein